MSKVKAAAHAAVVYLTTDKTARRLETALISGLVLAVAKALGFSH